MSEKVGRNEPCPCGSGLKYKKCCLPKDREKEKSKEEEITIEVPEEVAAEEGEEVEEISDEDALRFYTTEFAKNGYSITAELLYTFFDRCLSLDGYMDSGRVKEFCDYLRKKHRIDIKKDDIEDFFGSL
jgi:hypothetical protein